MRPRIGADKIALVRRLLGTGMGQRSAAKESGVSLPIVNEIAQGKRAEQFSEDATDFQSVAPYTCPGCHRRVNTAPCVACTNKRGA